MAIISMRALLETGVHFGHRCRRWNPKMRPYIFTQRNGIHIIDLQQTITAIEDAFTVVRDTVGRGGSILFLGTKRQAQDAIQEEADRCAMPYVNQRWLGGTLTNWRTIRERIQYLKNLEARRDRGEFQLVTKKEALMLTREIDRLQYRLGGIREMNGLPDLLFVVDSTKEETAVHEANILGIPIVAMVDTNSDPDQVDHVIPANDDAIRAIRLITSKIADAVLEGTAMRKDELDMISPEAMGAPSFAAFEEGAADEDYLGEATLAKLRDGTLGFAPDATAAAEAEQVESEAEQVEPEAEQVEPEEDEAVADVALDEEE